MPKKSIYRQPNAQHFQLVHRSQRDPLVHDPDAPQRLFKEVGRLNENKTGQTLNDLEKLHGSSSSTKNPPLRANEGEATMYGVLFDDTEYDYMQHLRGVDESRIIDHSATLAPAPRGGSMAIGNRGAGGRNTVKAGGKGKGRAVDDDEEDFMFGKEESHVLPSIVLPSKTELTFQQATEAAQAIPSSLQGFQPDMDPHLRQVLEALEDDEFVEDDSEEGWFDELLGGGEAEEGRAPNDRWAFREEGIEPDGTASWQPRSEREEGVGSDDEETEQSWQDRFKAFKASGQLESVARSAPNLPEDDLDDYEERSEVADTLASLPSIAPSVLGAKKRRRGAKAASDASGYSMSSSSMFRNKGLSTLDEMFDKIERDYEQEAEDEDFDDEDFDGTSEYMSDAGTVRGGGDDDNASIASFATATTFTRMIRKQAAAQQETEVSREDFEAIMDDFLDNYEVVGKKMVQVLPGHSGAEKLESVRRALVGLDMEGDVPDLVEADEDEEGSLAGGTRREAEYIRKRFLRDDAWQDGAEQEKMPVLHIVGEKENKWDCETILSTKSNLENHPRLIGVTRKQKAPKAAPSIQEEADDLGSDSDTASISSSGTITQSRVPVTRPRDESKTDKKARKLAVKADRASRRLEKKGRQETFGLERKTQLKERERAVRGGRASDLTALASGGQGSINVVRL